MSSPVPERRGSAMHASVCGRGTGLRCRPGRTTRIRWSTSRTAEPLVYLCISTMRRAEIVEYPDSGKVGAGVADPTNPVGFRRIGMFRAGSGTLDYWESEPEAG